ncbi:zinc finger protein 70-like [Anopheles maculipalpis]|uniref:zinc finger protein 70-like n=1 Tax=Anopheles maculipalpis TaxID=1496333 RepID=UPI0021597347|nr:zinc finger protein 70-like [Anopheles maculipalpis]
MATDVMMDWDIIDIFNLNAEDRELDIEIRSILLKDTSYTTILSQSDEELMDQHSLEFDKTNLPLTDFDPLRQLTMGHSSSYWKPSKCTTPTADLKESVDCDESTSNILKDTDDTDIMYKIDASVSPQDICSKGPYPCDDQPDSEKNNNLQPCPHCNKHFSCKTSLAEHLRRHTNERPFQCPSCPKAFRLSSTLSAHKKLHDLRGPSLRCDTCGRTFTQPSALSSHRLLHREDRPHCCGLCGKQFVRLHALKTHVLSHANERPFECDQCGKTFTEKHVLVRHRKTHSDERPHECEVCSKAFKERYDLLRHTLIHSGLRPHKCPDCSKTFVQSNALAKHRKCHERERFVGHRLDTKAFVVTRSETTCC